MSDAEGYPGDWDAALERLASETGTTPQGDYKAERSLTELTTFWPAAQRHAISGANEGRIQRGSAKGCGLALSWPRFIQKSWSGSGGWLWSTISAGGGFLAKQMKPPHAPGLWVCMTKTRPDGRSKPQKESLLTALRRI